MKNQLQQNVSLALDTNLALIKKHEAHNSRD